MAYRNPFPVVVCLISVLKKDETRGILAVRRGIEPFIGKLALPGGYIEMGETWQEAFVRELREETDIDDVLAEDVCVIEVVSTPDKEKILIFGALSHDLPEACLDPSWKTEETEELVIVSNKEAIESFCFSTHRDVAKEFWEFHIGN